MVDHRTTEHLLDIQNVSLKFGDNLVLRDVNAIITRSDNLGEVIGFLGPSGIGKTQLSRIVAGLQAPTSGQVLLSDGTPTGPGLACMVPQSYPMFDYLTVRSNLEVAGRQGGLSPLDNQHKVETLSEQLGLKDHWDKYPCALSGGTKQRVAIARQLMCSSHYMVMDEPFSGLDPIMKCHAGEVILQLAQMDTYNTIIIVTHDIVQALKVSDMVWLMGYERDGNNNPIAGARLVETIDLAALGLAWEPGVERKSDFLDLVHHVEDRFETLR